MFELAVRCRAGTYPVTVGVGSVDPLAAQPDTVIVADHRFAALTEDLPWPAVLIEATEENKTVTYADHLLGRLKAAGATRDSHLLAIGGGVVQDLATFAASIYMRGLRWMYAPTTLTAMADSCIGGKSSLNVDGYKNLAGNFHPPAAVAVDPTFLATLSDEQLAGGLAEQGAQRGGVGLAGIDDDRRAQAEMVSQTDGQLGVDAPGVTDLDADQPAREGVLEQPRHLEPAKSQFVGDLNFRAPVDVVAARHRRTEDELRRPGNPYCGHGSFHQRCVGQQGTNLRGTARAKRRLGNGALTAPAMDG